MSPSQLSRDQQELVDILRNELAELIEQDSSALESCRWAERREYLQELHQHLDNIGNASELVGLLGLGDACHYLSANLALLAESEEPFCEDVLLLVQGWGIYLLAYLRDIADPEAAHLAAADLLSFLSAPEWPAAMSERDRRCIQEHFLASELAVGCEFTENPLPQNVTEEMVSLAIADDVRPELLQGMLTELPEQVRLFEQSIAAYLGSGKLHDLAPAQRLAHTIKGSANVVGIVGIANLMHYTEDLLEAAAKFPEQLSEGFEEVLLLASDCLATMGEALAHLGQPPGDAVDVLAQLVDWLRRLRQSNLKHQPHNPALEHRIEEPQHEARSAVTSAVETKAAGDDPPSEGSAQEQSLTVTEFLADELLRLAGETQISNTQVAAQVEGLAGDLKTVEVHHRDIRTLASELERLVEIQSTVAVADCHQSDTGIDPLELERYNELHSFSHKLLELVTDSEEAVQRIARQANDLKSLARNQQRLNKDNQQLVLSLRMIPVKTMSARFARCVRQASRLTGKQAMLSVEGEELLMDSRVLYQVADPIMHLLRNALDHGLEPTDERVALGKAPEGRIRLRFQQLGETVTIECHDDGRGLDYERIAAVARAQRLVDEASPDPAELRQLIMTPGFSTRDTVSQTSGRGIGLDAVAARLREMKGGIALDSEPGLGCCFTLTVPTSIISGHALLVRSDGSAGEQILSIVTRSIERIVYLQPGELVVDSEQLFYEANEEKVPVYQLNDLTQIHLHTSETAVGALLLALRQDGSRFAVAVDTVLTSQDLVIKPLGRYTWKPPGVIGATVLGNGTVSPVVNLQELPCVALAQDELTRQRAQRARLAAAQGMHSVPVMPMALVVDDSLSARRAAAQFLADLGLEVRTARDGFEAIAVIERKIPVLVLADLEMPRMNGLELTQHIRSRLETRYLPIVMITSRTTEKHRRLADAAGVDAYLSKPWSEDDLLALVQKFLMSKAADVNGAG